MKYYRLINGPKGTGTIVCNFSGDSSISMKLFSEGKLYDGDGKGLSFVYSKDEGTELTDLLANDKGWLIVSEKLMRIMRKMRSEIQYIPVHISEATNGEAIDGYYIANVITRIDAVCLEISEYTSVDLREKGRAVFFKKYGLDSNKIGSADIFKLLGTDKRPVFISEKTKKMMEKELITGIELITCRTV